MQQDATLPDAPQVSVLIAVHNGLPYLEAALRSVMGQTLREIEIIVVDDASTDATPAVLARLAAEDRRIRIETLPRNLRLAGALNHGMAFARAPYVARMDADDLSHPDRLAIQKRFMDAHPEVVLCGTSSRDIDAGGQVLKIAFRPRDSVMCRWLTRFHMPLTHPTFMFRRVLQGGGEMRYDTSYPVAQDHDFMVRSLAHGEVVSLPDVLLDYRVHGASTTAAKWNLQQEMSDRLTTDLIATDLPPAVLGRLQPFRTTFFQGTPPDLPAFFGGLRAMLVHDSARHPAHARWFRRQTAQLAWEGLGRGGLRGRVKARAYLRHGADFLPALALRALEIRRVLPNRLRSDAAVLAAMAETRARAGASAPVGA